MHGETPSRMVAHHIGGKAQSIRQVVAKPPPTERRGDSAQGRDLSRTERRHFAALRENLCEIRPARLPLFLSAHVTTADGDCTQGETERPPHHPPAVPLSMRVRLWRGYRPAWRFSVSPGTETTLPPFTPKITAAGDSGAAAANRPAALPPDQPGFELQFPRMPNDRAKVRNARLQPQCWQLPPKLRLRPRWHIAPPRHPAEHARLPFRKRTPRLAPVPHRARADSIFRRKLQVRLFGVPVPPRAQVVAEQIHVRQDAVLLVRNRRLTRGHAQEREQHGFNGVLPRRRVDAAVGHARQRSTMIKGIRQKSVPATSASFGVPSRMSRLPASQRLRRRLIASP